MRLKIDDLDEISEKTDACFVTVVWQNKGDEFGYAWPDIRVTVEFSLFGLGVMLPSNLMTETEAKVTLGTTGMYPTISKEDMQIVLDDAVAKFGKPTNLEIQ